MKTRYIALLMLLFSTSISIQATEDTDTVFKQTNLDEVVISESVNSFTVSVKGKNENGEYTKEYNAIFPDSTVISSNQWEERSFTNFKICTSDTTRRWSNEIIGGGSLLLGFMTTTNTPDNMKMNHGRISEISWLNMIYYQAKLKKSNHSFSIGFGLSWRSFSLLNSQTFTVDNGKIGYADYAGTATLKRSRLKVFSLSVPVLWNWKFCKNHNLKLGPIVNFNTHASLKTTTKAGNTESDISTTDISKRPVTVDLYGAIEVGNDVGLYVRYSPMSVFKTNCTPDIRPLSFGIVFGF